MAPGIWQLLIVLVIVLILFGGGGKLKKLMGDAGSGISAFKKGLKGDKKEEDQNQVASEAIESETTEKVISEEKKDKV